jgi:DNA-binding transcriptional ArsR family regulator
MRRRRSITAASGRATQPACKRPPAGSKGPRPPSPGEPTCPVEDWPAGSPFGATAVAAEIGRRFGYEVTPSAVSVKLRRLRGRGALRAAREGQSHVESLFEKS